MWLTVNPRAPNNCVKVNYEIDVMTKKASVSSFIITSLNFLETLRKTRRYQRGQLVPRLTLNPSTLLIQAKTLQHKPHWQRDWNTPRLPHRKVAELSFELCTSKSRTLLHTPTQRVTLLFRANSHSMARELPVSVTRKQMWAKRHRESDKGKWLKLDTGRFSGQT